MILFFNLNASDVFDNVLHIQFLYNMKKKDVEQIVKINRKFSEK